MSEEKTAETAGKRERTPSVELARDMGLTHVTMIGVGAMIGAGIFVLTGLAAGEAGPALLLVFLFNGIVTTLTAMSYAELGSCFPEAGGGYLWVKEALPQPNGFLSGWISWFAHSVACSLYSVAFGSFAVEILSLAGLDLTRLLPIPTFFGYNEHEVVAKLIATAVVLLFAYINYRGAEETGQAETFITIAKIIVISLFIAFGCYAIFAGKVGQPWQDNFRNFFPKPLGIITAMGLTFIAFEGYEIIAQCGEEVKNPKRNIPLSIFLSLLIVVPIYILVAFVALGAVSVPEEAKSAGIQTTWEYLGKMPEPELAMAEAAGRFMPWGKMIFLIGGLFSTMSALNATIYSSSRVSFAMGRDRNLPNIFGHIHPRKRTPHWAIFISSALIILMLVALPIEDIASATDAMFLILFIFVNLAIINLRKNRPDLDRGFKIPLSPYTPIIATVLNLFLVLFLFGKYPLGIAVSFGYVVLGIIIYYLYAKRREFEATAEPTIYAETPVFEIEPRDFHILVPMANEETADQLLQFATLMAKAHDADITVLNVIQVPAQLPPSEGRKYLNKARSLLDRAIAIEENKGIPIYTLVKVAHNIPKAIIETCEEKNIDLMVLGWEGDIPVHDRVFGTILDEIILNTVCDIAMVRRAATEETEMDRVLIPIASIRYALLSLQIAEAMLQDRDIPIVLFHATAREDVENIKRQYEEELRKYADKIDPERYEVVVRKAYGVVSAVLAETQHSDLIIMGSPEEGLLRRAFFGDIPERIVRAVDMPVILTKRYTGSVKSWFQKFFGARKTMLQ